MFRSVYIVFENQNAVNFHVVCILYKHNNYLIIGLTYILTDSDIVCIVCNFNK